jgi:hypothetical protein
MFTGRRPRPFQCCVGTAILGQGYVWRKIHSLHRSGSDLCNLWAASLPRFAFDDAGRHGGGNDAQEPETGRVEEFRKLFRGALLAAGHNHHV